MARYDIALTDNDVDLTGGDIRFAVSDQQHIEDTIRAFPSWWKEYPDDGVGIASYLNGATDTQKVAAKIRIQLQSDGYTVNNPVVKLGANGKLIVNPNATI
jgi:hypothetical protein